MISITYRITGLMFLLIAITVFLLIYLANQQMSSIFQDYVFNIYETFNGHGMMMGPMFTGGLEEEFMRSVHDSLIWVGTAIMLVGLAASYTLARSITVPLRKLYAAVREIERGKYEQQVEVNSNDEVELLAKGFNHMAKALETNNQQRKQLLADIAHELRTPLAIIQGNLEGMLDGVIERDNEQISSLYEETVHLNRLIKDLRDLSLAEAGQLSLEKAPNDMNQLVSRAVNMIKPLADSKKIDIKCDMQELPIIEVDASRISQVVYNLLTNAVRYTADNGNIEVKTWTSSKTINIAVCDNGQGISQEDLAHIFDHFYRADKSRTRASGGSGIGLAVVKQLVDTHGGAVHVESTVGVGSCFYVSLPLE